MNEAASDATQLSEAAWAVRNAIERLAAQTDGGIEHLLAHAPDAATGERWARAVTAGLAQLPQWERNDEDAAALDPGLSGERWWAAAERRAGDAKIRIAVEVRLETWEKAMAPSDDAAIYVLRKRLAEARRVHVVAVRDTHAKRNEDTHVQLARERTEMTMAPTRVA